MERPEQFKVGLGLGFSLLFCKNINCCSNLLLQISVPFGNVRKKTKQRGVTFRLLKIIEKVI